MIRAISYLSLIVLVAVVVYAIVGRHPAIAPLTSIPVSCDRLIQVKVFREKGQDFIGTVSLDNHTAVVDVFASDASSQYLSKTRFPGETICWNDKYKSLVKCNWSDSEGRLIVCAVNTLGAELERYAGVYPGPPPVKIEELFASGEVLGVAGAESDWEHDPLGPVVMSFTQDPTVLFQRGQDVFSVACCKSQDASLVAFSFRNGGAVEIGQIRKQGESYAYSQILETSIKEPCGLAFADEGKLLVALSMKRITVVNIGSGNMDTERRISQEMRPEQLRYAISSSGNGKLIGYIDASGAYVANPSLTRCVCVTSSSGTCINLSDGGSTLAVGVSGPPRVEVYDTKTIFEVPADAR